MIHFRQALVVAIIYLTGLTAKADCSYLSNNFHEKAVLACTYESDALNLESKFPVFWNRIHSEATNYCSIFGTTPRFYSEGSYVPHEMLPGEADPYLHTAYGETTYYLYFVCPGTDYVDGNDWIVPGRDDDYSVTSIEIIQNDNTAIDSDHDGVIDILPFVRSTIRINFNHAHPAVMEQTDPYIKVYIDGAGALPGSPEYARFTDNFRAEGAHSAVFSFLSPTTPGTHEIKVVIDEDQLISEADYSNNTMTLQFSTEPPKPSNSLSIDRMRMAQTVFDPVIDPGQPTLALVSDKDFAVDVALSGSLSSEFNDSTATAQVLVDGVAAGPVVEFKPSGINNGANRLFAYGRYNSEGVHQVAVQIKSKNHQIPNVLDDTHYLEESTTRTFFRTSMKVLTGQVLGCTTGTSCFSSPNSQDISNFNVSQLTLANQLLPVSGNGLTLEKGADIQGSQPGFFALAKDFLKIWKLKHDANATAAAYLVSESYMTKMGQDHAGTETAGMALNTLHVSLISARGYNVLTHELIHSLRSGQHSPLKETEGFNVGTKTVYGENFKSLTDNVIIAPLKAANVFYYEVQEERKLDQLIDPYTYSNTFRDIMIPSIDPKVILVSGAVDNSGQVAFIDATSSETILDPEGAADIEIRGLNSAGKILSFVKTGSIKSYESFGGPSQEVSFPGYIFAATLPDPGGITMLHLVKDGHLIATQSIKEAATLENVIHRLTKGDFKSALLGTIELKVLRDEYAAYSKLVTKSRRSEAKATLLLLKLTAGLSLKKSFTLNDSTPFTLAEFYKLVDAEANNLR